MNDLAAVLGRLPREGSVPASDWPAGESPETYGLEVVDGRVVPTGRYEPLQPLQIRNFLSRRAGEWLRRLEVFPVIGSTNAELMELARHQPLHGTVYLAELQIQGRGRRGRAWFSPFGANLAVSMGMAVDLPPARLGGVSLVVGLAAMDALDRLGVTDVTLKWPNDVLLGGAKLGGILIEMVQHRGTEIVIGVGLNVTLSERLRAGLPQAVADLSGVSPPPSRNELAGRLISSVVEFVAEFERQGFDPFKAAYQARHYYHERECRILQGDRQVTGTVAGVTDFGELILRTADGPRTFNAGEVSLR